MALVIGFVTQISIDKSWCCITLDNGQGRKFLALLWSRDAQPDVDAPKSIVLQDRFLALVRDAYLNNKKVQVASENTSGVAISVTIINN